MNSEKKEFVMSAKNILQTEVYMPGVLTDCNGDFVLPDYMPKVQKVLRLEAHTTPPAKFVGAKDIGLSGNVLCSLVYLGEDGEIGATVLPSKYEFSIPFDKNGAPQMLSAAVDVDTLNYRLSGPRKLSIRTRLRAKPRAFFSTDISPMQEPEEREDISKLYGEIDSVNTVLLNANEITVSDSIPLGVGENSHLIWCGATAAVSDVKAVDGGVSVRGEVISKVIADDDGTLKFFSKKTPFEEFMEGDVNRGAGIYAYASVVSTEASKDSDEEALVDVIVSVEALADMQCKIPILKDVFSSKGEGSVESREFENRSSVASRSGIYNVGASVPVADVSSVLDASGNALIDEIIVNGGELTASGRCLLNVICLGDENGVISNEYTVPFKITLGGDYSDAMVASGSAVLLNTRSRIDGNNIVFDMDIALCVRAAKNESIATVEKYDFKTLKPYTENKYPLCVVYSSGESLWTLAKKYHTSPEKLAKINMLDVGEADMQKKEKLASCRALMLELK
ncbi:MAG: LysM peptidoglycan-binding domain-containing protein [Ruminococcaceae bacterium]|nr:LysM peptidoglycan-binding domain-containing protein [Oscillospiraceae bacterium]